MRSIFIAVAVLSSGLTAAPAAAKPDPPLRAATYNVCKTSCGTGRFAWERRKGAVIRTILRAKPDVLALQEADNSFHWIAQRLAGHGYARVEPLTDDCTDQGCIDDSQLFYRTARVTPLATPVPNEPVSEPCRPFIDDAGQLLPSPAPPTAPQRPVRSEFADSASYRAALREWEMQHGATWRAYETAVREHSQMMWQYRQVDREHNCERFIGRTPLRDAGSGLVSFAGIGAKSLQRSVDNRNFAWAVLRDRRTGGAFVAVSLHMPNEKTPAAERYRKQLAGATVRFLTGMQRDYGIWRAPVVLMGDLNSFAARQPRGAQWIFGRRGFSDAFATASTKVHQDVSTANITPDRNPWPAAPRRLDEPARLDYVLYNKGRALRYEVALRLRPNGTFDNMYRGSDHNLVLADLELPRVPPGARWRQVR